MTITPNEFVSLWAQASVREQQGAQTHFNQLCELVGHKTPIELDPQGEVFTFEEHVEKATGGKGRADVWYSGHFAWEYKGKHKDLDAAYAQLLAYRGGLGNPPLLVVCDFLEYRIYPQWPNTSGQPFVFHNDDLTRPDTLRYITWLLESPERFLELRQEEQQKREQITRDLADKFAHLADLMRQQRGPDGQPLWNPLQIARFLTKLVFALFVEDVGLLPRPYGHNIFRYIVDHVPVTPEAFVPTMTELFQAMDGRNPGIFMHPVPYFNGGLFAESSPGMNDGLEVLDLTQVPAAIDVLGQASEADWRDVDPAIFGTLFEGALDPAKRAQLGAHFTGESDIRLVVEPVLMQPLYRLWDETQAEAAPLLQTFLQSDAPREVQTARDQLTALHDHMMDALANTRVLDPACGSGNFLYVSLRAMKDLEARVRKLFEPLGLPFRDVVTPRQFLGIEKDEFAARLAYVVTWIGYLQWRFQDEGVLHPLLRDTSRPHPRQLPHPILQDDPSRIVNDDAIMRYDAEGKPYEPDWPEADVIMGNPPFLGAKWMQRELGEKYKSDLWELYDNRVSGTADLVTYWFEKARAAIEPGKAKRVGLLATNTIRQGGSGEVLKRIKATGNIFFAYTDHPWTLAGAALRIALVGFDNGTEVERTLNGKQVAEITSDLREGIDVGSVKALVENQGLSFRGHERGGPFLIDAALAQRFLSNRKYREVVHPWYSGQDLTGRSRGEWIIDFGIRELEEAEQYPEVLEYLRSQWEASRNAKEEGAIYREKWWRHRRPATDLRSAISQLKRFIVTPLVSKHRLFVWLNTDTRPDTRLVAFSRDDDYFLGVLHSYIHQLWSLRLSAHHGIGNDPVYNNTALFETFPFPWPPGSEDTGSPHYAAIADAARTLHAERDAWLNPPDDLLNGPARERLLRERTLTNLYNAVEAYRETLTPQPPLPQGEGEQIGNRIRRRNGQTAAQAFAPRLAELHDALDRAVLAAYGWEDMDVNSGRGDLPGRPYTLRTPEGDEELLRRLLALNLERAGAGS